ncbi:slightly ste11-like protein [Marasmius crinis-equi]|uniref:Slightly ste11-like protein n=1 Tax=Marasmius crinis-equi TaxID=585013 RepID=A0ABR3F1H0_9AGAR
MPPRPMNPWIIYRREQSAILRAQYKNQGIKGRAQTQLSKIISERWRKLPESEKQKYEVRAAIEKVHHAQMYPDYVYQPNRDGTKKTKSRSTGKMQRVKNAQEEQFLDSESSSSSRDMSPILLQQPYSTPTMIFPPLRSSTTHSGCDADTRISPTSPSLSAIPFSPYFEPMVFNPAYEDDASTHSHGQASASRPSPRVTHVDALNSTSTMPQSFEAPSEWPTYGGKNFLGNPDLGFLNDCVGQTEPLVYPAENTFQPQSGFQYYPEDPSAFHAPATHPYPPTEAPESYLEHGVPFESEYAFDSQPRDTTYLPSNFSPSAHSPQPQHSNLTVYDPYVSNFEPDIPPPSEGPFDVSNWNTDPSVLLTAEWDRQVDQDSDSQETWA